MLDSLEIEDQLDEKIKSILEEYNRLAFLISACQVLMEDGTPGCVGYAGVVRVRREYQTRADFLWDWLRRQVKIK